MQSLINSTTCWTLNKEDKKIRIIFFPFIDWSVKLSYQFNMYLQSDNRFLSIVLSVRTGSLEFMCTIKNFVIFDFFDAGKMPQSVGSKILFLECLQGQNGNVLQMIFRKWDTDFDTSTTPMSAEYLPMALPMSCVQSRIQLRSPLPTQPQTRCGWWRVPPDTQSRDLRYTHPACLWPWSHSWRTKKNTKHHRLLTSSLWVEGKQ